MSFWDQFKWLFAPLPKPAQTKAPTKKEITKPTGKTISKGEFEAMVGARAALLAGGMGVSPFHYSLAREQITKELAGKGVTVMGRLQSKGIEDAASEAGGADKI